VINLPTNELVTDFSLTNFKGYNQVLKTNITFSKYYNIAAIEINSYFKDHLYNSNATYKSIPPSKVFRINLTDIKLKPIAVFPGTKLDICFSCRSQLYDDNYVLCRPTTDHYNKFGIAYCPLCIHSVCNNVVSEYMIVARVTFPKTHIDVINESELSDDKKEILKYAVCNKITYDVANKCLCLGDKYYVFEHINDYIYNSLSKDKTKSVIISDSVRHWSV
jgi:hypothetical protein